MNVLIADFLRDASIEKPVLDDVAQVVVADAHHEDDLRPHLAVADAIILFHDIERMGESTFSKAPRCRAVVRAGVGYNNVDLEAAGRLGIAVCQRAGTTGPRRSPTTPSCSSWPWPATWSSRTDR